MTSSALLVATACSLGADTQRATDRAPTADPQHATAEVSVLGTTTGPCIAGTSKPMCTFWRGKVVSVSDGDTYKVVLDGASDYINVRVTGINATEQTVYSSDPRKRRGECHALEATARVEELLRAGGWRVRLSAQDPKSMSGTRFRRRVETYINGAWRDIGRILLQEGRALWLPNTVEYVRNRRYSIVTQQASDRRVGLFDRDYCGSGPYQSAGLRVWPMWDADGADGRNLNGEWIRVKNLASYDLPIGGWWIRDSHHRRYTFPSGARIRARSTVTVYVGKGSNTSTRFYWGQSGTVFENVTGYARYMGDGAYLFDPQGDLRAWLVYPCRDTCSAGLRRKINLRARSSGTEYATIENISSATVNLEGYVLRNYPYTYAFRAPSTIRPGEVMRVYVGGSPSNSTRLRKYWGKNTNIFNDSGDVVEIKTYDDIRADCYSWGSGSC